MRLNGNIRVAALLLLTGALSRTAGAADPADAVSRHAHSAAVTRLLAAPVYEVR